jgi:hypothetical protein
MLCSITAGSHTTREIIRSRSSTIRPSLDGGRSSRFLRFQEFFRRSGRAWSLTILNPSLSAFAAAGPRCVGEFGLRLQRWSTQQGYAPKLVRAAESTAKFFGKSRHLASHSSCRGRELTHVITAGQNVMQRKGEERGRSFNIRYNIRYFFFVQHTTLAVDYASLQNLPCTTWSIYTSIYIYSNMNSARLSNYERRESLQNLTHVQFIHIFHSTYVFESTHPPKSTYIFPPTRSIHVQFTQRAPHHENPTKQKEEHNNTPEPRTQSHVKKISSCYRNGATPSSSSRR